MKENILKINKNMQKAIKRSGYLLEQEIATTLKPEGFYVIPNYAFRDIETESSKEVDVWALTAESIFKGKEYLEGVFTNLLIEAKNVSPLVCFTQEEVNTRYTAGDLQFSGMPKYIWTKQNEGIELLDFLKIEKFHHYYKTNRIASQFCIISENKKRRGNPNEPPYIASHNFGGDRNLYEELALPLIKCIISEKTKFEEEWEFDPKSEPINLQFYYPIAVVTGLFECYIGGKEPVYKKVHRLNFIRRYESKKISGDFRIDICDRIGLKHLITDIQKEMEKITNKIKRNKKLFKKSALKDARKRFQERQRKSKSDETLNKTEHNAKITYN